MQVKKQQLEPDMEQTHSKLGKENVKVVNLPFNSYTVHIMKNSGLDEAEDGINIAKKNINNLRYADDTILMTENEEKLKSLLMKVKEESKKAGLILNVQKSEIMVSSPITLWKRYEETIETGTNFIILGSKITADGDRSHEIKDSCPLKEKLCPA